jgi:2-oxoglutarate ferredoxin oxidoreductase subunit alpha
LFVAYGSVARTSLYIVKQLRAEGIKAGLFIPKVLWPFPEKAFKAVLNNNIKHVIVPEMNLGQYVLEVERNVAGRCPTSSITKVSGELFKTEEIYEKVMAVINR